VAALVVGAIIFTAAGGLVYENARVLMDTTPAQARARGEAAINGLGDEVELRRLRLRESGGRHFADAVVGVPPGQAVVESHGTADAVETAVRDVLPDTDVVVHLEPRREGLDLRDRILAVALAEPLVREAHDITIYEHDGLVSVSLHLKMAADVTIQRAHEVAERVEAALRQEPGVQDVHTHLEPLEQPVAARPQDDREQGDEAERQRIFAPRPRSDRRAAAGVAPAPRGRRPGRVRQRARAGGLDAGASARSGQPAGGRHPRGAAACPGRGRAHRAVMSV
jgi:divalent metal cation (Fe/Co/Zn/Cd) transporter